MHPQFTKKSKTASRNLATRCPVLASNKEFRALRPSERGMLSGHISACTHVSQKHNSCVDTSKVLRVSPWFGSKMMGGTISRHSACSLNISRAAGGTFLLLPRNPDVYKNDCHKIDWLSVKSLNVCLLLNIRRLVNSSGPETISSAATRQSGHSVGRQISFRQNGFSVFKTGEQSERQDPQL